MSTISFKKGLLRMLAGRCLQPILLDRMSKAMYGWVINNINTTVARRVYIDIPYLPRLYVVLRTDALRNYL